MSVRCEIKNYQTVLKRLDDMKKAPQTVIRRTVADMRTRVPAWVAAEVSKVYGIKKAEVNGGKIGKMRVEGDSVDTVKVIYTGRPLTPTHFGMTPMSPGVNAYTLKASIFKGQKKTLGKVKKLTKKQRAALGRNFTRSGEQQSSRSPIMLMHTGAKSAEKTQYIPFQRVSEDRDDLKAVKTLSLPQMVSSEKASDGIRKAINEGLEKRLANHLKQLGG